jgi:hypothetical protein
MMPVLTRAMASPHRDEVRGLLYAGHARLNLKTPPCSLLAQAHDHFEAASRTAPLEAQLSAYATWVRDALERCPADR